MTKICSSLSSFNLASDFGDKLPFTATIDFFQVAISLFFFLNKYYWLPSVSQALLFLVTKLSDPFAIPWTVAHQAPLSKGFPRQEHQFSSVEFSCSAVSDSLQPNGPQHARLPCPSPTPGACSNSCSIEQVMPSNHLILCRPLLLLPSIFPSIRVPSNESVLRMRWPKYWSFNFSISPSNEYSGLISFRMDWLDFPAVQGSLKSLLQHHSSKASILRLSALFIVHLSHLYMTTGKTIALTGWIFAGKVMSLLFNILSRFVIAFLPRRKRPLISWLQSKSAVILDPPKIDWVAIFFSRGSS